MSQISWSASGARSGPGGIVPVRVKHGVVTLTGTMPPEPDLVPLTLRLIWDIDGVVDVVNRLGEPTVARTA